MFTIKAEKISYKYDDAIEPIINEISLDIGQNDKIALIGPNGKGKTTLIKLILKQLHPTSGTIHYPKQQINIAYMEQNFVLDEEVSVQEACRSTEIEQMERELVLLEKQLEHDTSPCLIERYGLLQTQFIEADGYHYAKKCEKILAGLGIDASMINRKLKSLSGGEKTRVQLAKLLVNEPDLLILDEPTNHLDYEMILWLENYVKNYPKGLLFVSHDRSFIDNVANKVIVLERKGYTILKSNYSEYLKTKEEEFNDQMKKYNERQDKISQLKEAAAARRKWASSFQRETGKEGKSYTFEMVTNPAKQMMRQAKSLEGRIRVMQESDPIEKPWIEKKRKISFMEDSRISETVFTLKDICKSFNGKIIFNSLNLLVSKQEKIHLKGLNGSGKSTLLKMLLGEILPDSGEILYGSHVKTVYFDQELGNLDQKSTIIDFLLQFNNDHTFVRTMMACLKIEREQVYRVIGTMSTGEQVKVSLASLLVQNANVLLLDEPTNHLDIEARIALENALQEYPGTIIFVSHDRTFIKNLATRVIDLNNR
ncbi:MAG TPA: ABC-F family ATP-binding cassette domain-containing protein [Candidatus Cloacimonadota bacterium]|nr:ABC-F family ATP-binding cassette domain-containing protein [Candidatus Cloacimonadota bacterium]